MIPYATVWINGVETIPVEVSDGAVFFLTSDQQRVRLHRLVQPGAAEARPGVFVDRIITFSPPIVILEQLIMPVPKQPGDFFKRLLQINNTLVHGAFVLDEDGKHVFFRDTLELQHLDKNELEGSIRALSFALAEHANELLAYAKA